MLEFFSMSHRDKLTRIVVLYNNTSQLVYQLGAPNNMHITLVYVPIYSYELVVYIIIMRVWYLPERKYVVYELVQTSTLVGMRHLEIMSKI